MRVTKKQTNESSFDKKLDFGMRLGVAKALYEHKRLGHTIAISNKNGKMVKIPAEKIPIPKEFKKYLENQ